MLTTVITLLTSYFPRKLLNNSIYLDDYNLNYNSRTDFDLKSDKKLDTLHSDTLHVGDTYSNREIKSNSDTNKFILNRIPNFYKAKDEQKYLILNKMSEQFRILEYSLVIVFILIGAMFLLTTNDFVSLFLSIELQSYGLYILCTIYKNSELSTSAGLTYFLLGALASCFILLGSAIFYSNTGIINLDGLHIIINLSDNTINTYNNIQWYIPNYVEYSLLILVVGLLFKISAAPFHFWSPDVYDNIPTIVTVFVALIPKLPILIFLMQLIHHSKKDLIYSDFNWISCLLLSSFLSLIIGTVLGLVQFRIKKLLAYSTISHLGFILLALSINSIESNQSFIFYLIQYTISNLNAFIILLAMGYGLFFYISNNIDYGKLQDKNNSPIQLSNQIKGYYEINPILTLSFTITLFSFVGIPPLIGFFAKQMVLSSALDKGYVFLVLIGILTSVISAVYYLNLIKKMYFDKHEYIMIKWEKYDNSNVLLSNNLSISISIITMIILLFIITPQELLNICNIIT